MKKFPRYILDFIIKRFDDNGTYMLEDLDRKETKWLFRRGLMRRVSGVLCVIGKAYEMRVAYTWRQKGFVALVS